MWPFAGYSSRELVTHCIDSSLKLDFSPISHTHPLQINTHKYRETNEEITIKFGTKLEPTQASWKSQLYMDKVCSFFRHTRTNLPQEQSTVCSIVRAGDSITPSR